MPSAKGAKGVAAVLGIDPATVKNHVHTILGKLEVRRRSDAASRASGRKGGRSKKARLPTKRRYGAVPAVAAIAAGVLVLVSKGVRRMLAARVFSLKQEESEGRVVGGATWMPQRDDEKDSDPSD